MAIKYEMRRAGEAGGGYWVTRLNQGAYGAASGRVINVGGLWKRANGGPNTPKFTTAELAAADMVGCDPSEVEIREGNGGSLIADSALSSTQLANRNRSRQEVANRIIGTGITTGNAQVKKPLALALERITLGSLPPDLQARIVARFGANVVISKEKKAK